MNTVDPYNEVAGKKADDILEKYWDQYGEPSNFDSSKMSYHGAEEPFKIMPGKMDLRKGPGSFGKGLYTTSDKGIADRYKGTSTSGKTYIFSEKVPVKFINTSDKINDIEGVDFIKYKASPQLRYLLNTSEDFDSLFSRIRNGTLIKKSPIAEKVQDELVELLEKGGYGGIKHIADGKEEKVYWNAFKDLEEAKSEVVKPKLEFSDPSEIKQKTTDDFHKKVKELNEKTIKGEKVDLEKEIKRLRNTKKN
jgi:hypothetical protein